MEDKEFVQALKDKIIKDINLSLLTKPEKDLIEVLLNLLDLFYNIIINNKNTDEYEEIKGNFEDIKKKIIEYLEKNYTKAEFYILDVSTFDDSSKYISTLLKNLLFYLTDYKPDITFINIYYYLFHLIYNILLIVVNSKEKNPFDDSSIKFYINHIIHFFERDKNSPEYNFFFYEGAFIYLYKKYQIKFKYLFRLDEGIIISLGSSDNIISLRDAFFKRVKNKKQYTVYDSNFIDNYPSIKKEITTALYEEDYDTEIINGETENLIKICNNMLNKVSKIEKIYEKYGLVCNELKNYRDKVNELIQIITINKLTDNHFALMFRNYLNNSFIINIETFLLYAKKWLKYKKELEEDYTEIFQQIINSPDFKILYLSAMESSYIKNFVISNNLRKNYTNFMEKYAKEIDKYILYVPLTRGIKAYVFNYFRIALNINSIELIGEFNNFDEKISVYKSYLLIQFLHESFHFLYRLDKKNKTCLQALSPIKIKIRNAYREIGADLIYHIFGTEYIKYFPLCHCQLLNSKESWEKEDTNFKVFPKTYLDGGFLVSEDKENHIGAGLKCNISLYEGKNSECQIYTNGSIRYCF